MKDYINCPICQAEKNGVSEAHSGSPQYYEDMKERHDKEHKSDL